MICKNCATGADVITRLYEMPEEMRTGNYAFRARDFIGVAKALHDTCKTRCDCQHAIRILNEADLKAQIQTVDYSGVSISKEQLGLSEEEKQTIDRKVYEAFNPGSLGNPTDPLY